MARSSPPGLAVVGALHQAAVMAANAPVAFLAWLSSADWVRWRALDPTGLQQTHREWLQNAKAIEQELQRQRIVTNRVALDPDEFARWCRETGIKSDGKARSRYAIIVGERRQQH